MNEKDKKGAQILELENVADRIKKSEYISNGALTSGYKYIDNELLQMWQEKVQYLIIELYGKILFFMKNF